MVGFEDYEQAVTGITSGYAFADGVTPRVPYSFMGTIYDEDERNLLLSVLDQEALTMGPQVGAFESEFAGWCDARHAFATTSCTTAMHVATQALGIGEGDEVIVTPNTFIATTLVILKEGGIPIYADIDPRTFNIDPEDIARKITPKTKAIFVVHYAGLVCDMDPIMAIAERHGLSVVEDASHAVGAQYVTEGPYQGRSAGSIGSIGCFSFFANKNLVTGEGVPAGRLAGGDDQNLPCRAQRVEGRGFPQPPHRRSLPGQRRPQERFDLVHPQAAVVDEDAGQAVADGLVQHGRQDR